MLPMRVPNLYSLFYLFYLYSLRWLRNRAIERRNLRNTTPTATRNDEIIAPSVALETILTSLPSKVFIKAGDVCCICLEVTKNPDLPLVGCRA